MEFMFAVLLILLLFWLTLVQPTQRQLRRQKSDIASLRVGDRVVTTAGFLATVHEIETPEQGSTQITLDLGGGVLVKALPSAIAQRVAEPVGAGRESSKEAV